MLRTVLVRGSVLRHSTKKVIRLTITRALAVEISKRKPPNRVISILQPEKVVSLQQLLRRYSGSFPPHTKVALPALSPTMNVGNIVSWEKKEGDQLQEGDVLAEIETDKATMGFETPEEGYLAKIIIPAGTKEVPVGKLVCIIVANAADIAAFKDYKDDGAPAGAAPSPAPPSPAPPSPAAPSPGPPPPPAAAPAPAQASSSFPAHTKVALPALSPTMNVGNIVSWEKKEGNQLQEGDVLAEIETDKATMGFETPEEGYLAKIIIPAGTKEVPVGKLVCIIVANAADVAAFKDYKDDGAPAGAAPSAAPPSPSPPSPQAAAPSAASASAPTGGRVYASPMAKKLAEQRQIRLAGKGTGLYGSITSSDLDKLAAAPSAAAPSAASPKPSAAKQKATPVPAGAAFVDIPLTTMRSVIAKRLLESKTTVPHYYVTVDCNIDKLLALRETINKKNEKRGPKVSVNDFIVKATALASIAHPEINSAWMDTAIRQYNDVDVSIAVSTPTGLITPIIFRANSKGINTISKEVKDLAGRARDGKLKPAEFQGGTITVSNLGMYGVAHFTAIINPPQCAILAVGGNQIRIIPDDKSEKGFKKAHFICATLSSDHRIVDGAKAAEWLSSLREYLEAPEMMIF